MLPFQRGKNWAFSIIETLDEPPGEIIEIAMANDHNSVMDALWIQPMDATHSLNISAGVLYPKVFLGRSFNFLAIASNSSCE